MTKYSRDDPASTLEARARAWAETRMSKDRFIHTTGVVETATQLATRFSIQPLLPLRLAAWIHDAAKECADEELLNLAERFSHRLRKIERQSPSLLHGVVAAYLARDELGLDDAAIFSAVAHHPTGHPKMSKMDKALFIADAIEPSRQFSWATQARNLAAKDLNQAVLFIATKKIERLLWRATPIDPRTVRLRNRLLRKGVTLIE